MSLYKVFLALNLRTGSDPVSKTTYLKKVKIIDIRK
jgi:hypothetical protein